MNMQETDFRVGSCTALTHYTKTMHPILNLWFKYDFFNKRLFRLTVVIWQVSWITIFCVACFLKSADNLPEFIKLGSMRLYAIGFLFGLLTLPPPGCFFDAMKLNVDKIEVLSPKPNKTDEENQ
jgi:Zn-dependent membrane protease YugP